jgi:hypothetical protein
MPMFETLPRGGVSSAAAVAEPTGSAEADGGAEATAGALVVATGSDDGVGAADGGVATRSRALGAADALLSAGGPEAWDEHAAAATTSATNEPRVSQRAAAKEKNDRGARPSWRDMGVCLNARARSRTSVSCP